MPIGCVLSLLLRQPRHDPPRATARWPPEAGCRAVPRVRSRSLVGLQLRVVSTGSSRHSRGENVLVGGIEQLVHTGERLVHEEYPDAEWPLSPQETDDLVREAFKPVWYSLFTFEGFHVVVACFIISSAIFRTCLVFLTTRILLEFVIVVRFLALTLVLVPGTVLMMMLGPEADVAAVATFGFVLVNCLLLAAECLALDGTFSLQRVVRSGGDGTERMCPREIRNAQEARLLEPLVSRV